MRIGLVLLIPSLLACGSDGTDESVSGVFPSSAFLGRQARVEISGDATSWKEGTAVDFGPGVTVQNVAVASPTALFAEITIAADAAPGLRDVLVTSGGDTLTLSQAFQLESAISVKFTGTLAQGSVAAFAINLHDFDTPFDTTSTGDGFFTPLEYTNTFIEAPTGVQMFIDSMDRYSIMGTALIDVSAAPGPLVVHSGLDDDLVMSRIGGDVQIEARTPMALTHSTPATGMVDGPLASTLYEFTTTGATNHTMMSATATNPDAQPGVIILGPSGSFDELVAFTPNFSAIIPGSKLYAIYWDNTGASGYNFSVRADGYEATAYTENEPGNNTAAGAVTVAKSAAVTGGQLATAADEDWYALDVAAGDIGKRIHVRTMGTNPRTDTRVQMFTGTNGATAFGDASADTGYHESHQSPAITAAGKYWVKVYASPEYSPSHKPYDVAIRLE